MKMMAASANNKHILSAVTAVMVINLAATAVALFKDVFLASYLGTSGQADAFFLAFFIPDTVGSNLVASALSVACVPLFSKVLVSRPVEGLRATVRDTLLYFSLFSLVLMILFYVFRVYTVNILGAGLSDETRYLCVKILELILPALLFFPLISIASALLQVQGCFKIPALAPGLLNLIFFIALIYLYIFSIPLRTGVKTLGLSIIVSVIITAGFLWFYIWQGGFMKTGQYNSNIKYLIQPANEVREIFRVFFPYLWMLMTTQIVLAIERYLASGLSVGSIAGLNYAYRVTQFPLWVFVAALSTVVFPVLSNRALLGENSGFEKTVNNSLRFVFLITMPLSISLFVMRVPVISVLLQRGSFDLESVRITEGILAGYSLSIVFQGIVIICLRAFLAKGNYRIPLMAGLFSAGITIVLDFILVYYWGSPGLGYGAAAGALLNSILLTRYLNNNLGIRVTARSIGIYKILGANLPVLLSALILNEIWYLISESGLLIKTGYVFGAITSLIASYILGMHFMKIDKGIANLIDRSIENE
jgi:putative peptidoglycan lipid II flippase